jgi:NAD(P)-dependent dehydrogenase (short-subunit alcohol dehydrogenase family)
MMLQGKVALVTGASRGIGRAIALRLGEEGAGVAVNFKKSEKPAQEVVDAISAMGSRAVVVKADVTDSSQVKKMVDDVVSELGRIDILVNNSGVLVRRAFLDITEQDWDYMINTNLKAFFVVGQEVARVMRDQGTGGKIVNVASLSSKNASPNGTVYSISKAGVTMLTKQMALELAPFNINVNEINPGLIETDLNRHDIARPEFRESRLARIPLRKIGRPEDLAGAVAFLVSDDAALITGASLFIDGGAGIW